MRYEGGDVCQTLGVVIRSWLCVPLVVGLLGVLTACANSSDEAVKVSTTTSSLCSLDAEVREQMAEWNLITDELTVAFLDLTLRPDYSLHSNRLVPKLEFVVQRIEYLTGCLATEQRSLFQNLLSAYSEKLRAYSALDKVSRGDHADLVIKAIDLVIDATAEERVSVCAISQTMGGDFPVRKGWC